MICMQRRNVKKWCTAGLFIWGKKEDKKMNSYKKKSLIEGKIKWKKEKKLLTFYKIKIKN